jgi:TP901 family phage tail tape measure protein
MATQTQRHIIQTVYDRTGLAQFKRDMQRAQRVSGQFGTKIAKDAQFAGIGIKKSFDKAGNVITKKTATFVKGGKQMKVAWQEGAKGAQALGVSVTKTGGAMGQFNTIIGKAIKRALVVAPVWLAIRSAMMLVIRTTREMIKAYIDLDEGLARIRTVMHGTAEDINTEMIAIKRQILDTAVDSRISIKDLAEVMYFLKTASLTAEQSMSAFEHTVNAMTGTGVGAKEMARAVAGVFNTMGKYIDDASSDAEKFQKIADVLTYTFTRQDVEMKELIAGYTKLAPFLSGLDDSFTDIVTTLGFLNTRLLRAGRTGRLTGRAILQITKNASKLASIFGITFDPDKPINFLKTIGAISKALKNTGKITFEQSEAIRQIFATRAGVAVKLLISHFEELEEVIKLAGVEAEGFAEKIAEIKMGTISAQAQRMKNIFAVLFEEFVSGYYGAGNLADALTLINDSFISMREPIRTTGEWLGWFTTQTSKVAIALAELSQLGRKAPGALKFIPGTTLLLNAKELFKIYKEMGLLEFQSFEKYRENQEKLRKEAEKEGIIRDKIKTLEEETSQIEINRLAVEKETVKHQIALLKARGASVLDIAKYNLQSLKSMRDMVTEEDYELELLKRENVVIQEQLKYRQQLVDKFEKAEINILKQIGTSELQILDIQERQLKVRQSQYQPIAYANELLDIQLKKEIALQNQTTKRKQLYESLLERMISMTEEERELTEEVITGLLPFTGKTLGHMFERLTTEEKEFAWENRKALGFTKEQITSLTEAMVKLRDIPKNLLKRIWGAIEEQPEMQIQSIRAVSAIIENLQIKSAGGFTIGEVGRVRGEGGEWESVTGRVPITKVPTTELNIAPSFGGITINLPRETLDKTVEISGKKLTEILRENPEFAKLFSNKFWAENSKGR